MVEPEYREKEMSEDVHSYNCRECNNRRKISWRFHTIYPKSESIYVAIALLFLSAFHYSVVIDFTLTH